MSPSSPPLGSGALRSASGIRTGGDTPVRFRVLPLRVVVAGRFGLAANQLHRLDSAGAGGLLERSVPTLGLRVTDRLRADGTDIDVRLEFRHRRDFAPGAVAKSAPDLLRVVTAHSALRSGATPASLHGSLAEFPSIDRALAAVRSEPAPSPSSGATPAPSPVPGSAPAPAEPSTDDAADDDSVDRLLGMVETPTPTAPGSGRADPVRSALSGFISQVARAPDRTAGPTAGTPPEALEAALAEQLAAVIEHPEFKALERAWAALRFLARRVDMRSALTIDVIEAGPEGIADALDALVPEDDPDPSGPVRLVVDLNDYDASDRDIARLHRLAAFGASRRAAVLSNAAPAFAGPDGLAGLAAMHDPETRFEGAAYTAWRGLRDLAEAGWLGLSLSRIALRDAADGRDDKTLKFARSRTIGRPLDIGGAPAVAALLIEAASATQWPCAIGTASSPSLDNLVLVSDPDTGFDGPVLPVLSAAAADSVAAAGFIALIAERGRDTARLLSVPSTRRPASREDAPEVSLIPRLFQAQVAHGLQWNADRIFGTSDHAALRALVEAYLVALMSGTGPNAGAEVRLDQDEDGAPVLAVHVRSGSQAAPGAAMVFDIPLAPGPAASSGEG